MKKNCQRTLNAWFQDDPFGKQGDSIWTDGDTIYSYNTWILAEPEDSAEIHWTVFEFNNTKYSRTTTTHQNAILSKMNGYGVLMRVHDNVPMGVMG